MWNLELFLRLWFKPLLSFKHFPHDIVEFSQFRPALVKIVGLIMLANLWARAFELEPKPVPALGKMQKKLFLFHRRPLVSSPAFKWPLLARAGRERNNQLSYGRLTFSNPGSVL